MENAQLLTLLTDGGAVADTTGVQTNKTPFLIGTNTIAKFEPTGFEGTVLVQTSEDNSAWTTKVTEVYVLGSDDSRVTSFKLAQYVRVSVTAWVGGTVSVHLQSQDFKYTAI